ncbi:uncharacterized protein [Solanum lycopersicum]|uniref:uncharacterized protein n=1 Tax=Solanum lycopersicum TaxID=4081 RepID=UPI000532E3C4|nr:uncharacterized protein LOC104645186 [Solanum lycopersicum]
MKLGKERIRVKTNDKGKQIDNGTLENTAKRKNKPSNKKGMLLRGDKVYSRTVRRNNINEKGRNHCKDYLRRPLWDKMLQQANEDTNPWCAVADFNVITAVEEKLGGSPYNMRKSMNFIIVIEACGLVDIGFNGHKFTWSIKRGINYRIWKRIDRAMVNDSCLESMPQTTITTLSSIGSDHCPLLMEKIFNDSNHTKYFEFLYCLVDSPNFMETVQTCLDKEVDGIGMWRFHQKLKRLANTSLEDTILKQKTQLQWFKDSDKNSKYFHSIIRGKKRKLFVHEIINEERKWIQDEEEIAQTACAHFEEIFTCEEKLINENNLECIPRMVSRE